VDRQQIAWAAYPLVAAQPAAQAFVTSLAKRQMRPKTIDAYARNLEDMLRVFAASDPPTCVTEAAASDIESYVNDLYQRSPPAHRTGIRHLNGSGLSAATIEQRLVTARCFFDFCLHRGLRSALRNPVPRGTDGFGAAHPRRGVLPGRTRLPWVPSDAVWENLVSHILRHESARNQAMIFLAYDGALRRTELVLLRLDDVDWSASLVTVRPETTKGGWGRSVTFSAATEVLLRRYVQGEREQILRGFGGDAGGPLFVSESPRNAGAPLSSGTFNDVIERLRTQVGLPQLHPHTFRHLRCTILKRSGVALDDIALYAGHKSVETTRLYVHLAPQEVGKRIREATAPFDARLARLVRDTHDAP
jgi:site-specific recombinase XerD